MQGLTSIINFINNSYLASSNAINFIIMVLILVYIVKKAHLGEFFEDSITKVEESIKKSDSVKYSSQKRLNQARDMMEKLPQDLKELEDNTKEKVEIFTQKLNKDTDNVADKIRQNIGKVLGIEEKNLSNKITLKASKMSLDRAKSDLIAMLKANPALHEEFINKSIEELEQVRL